MPVTIQKPLRDDKQIICGYDDIPVLLNPKNIESIKYVSEISKCVITFVSQSTVPVAESIDELSRAFEHATA